MPSRISNPSPFKLACAFLALAAIMGACAPGEPEEPLNEGPSVTIKPGKVDPSLVGVWSTQDRKSIIDLGKDGLLKLTVDVPARGGGGKETSEGKWSVADSDLQLDVVGKPMVYGYKLEASGALKLKHSRLKEPLEYRKSWP